MKKLTPIRLSIFVAVLAVFMLVLALPTGNVLATESKPPNVRFTVINYSQHPFSMDAYGPESFSIDVAPYSKKALILPRGTYSYVMETCNHTASGKLDLNIYQTMHVPICGGNAGTVGQKHHNIDVADTIKMVRIKIRNQTWEPIHLYLRTLDNHYYLDLEPKEITTLVVPRDRYVYSYVACGDLEAGYFQSVITPPLDLKCSDK